MARQMRNVAGRAVGLLRAALCGGVLALAGPLPAVAQNFEPVVVVNDAIITNFDVVQRARLLQAAGGSGDARGAALQGLIEDTLRLQAAKRFGIDPTPEQINAGFDELAAQNGRSGDEMRAYFLQQGVSREALAKQVAAEVAWRQLIRQRYLPRVRVSDAEISEAVAKATGAGGETEYLLAEIRLPIDAAGSEAALQRGRNVLVRLSQGEDFISVARSVSSGPSASVGGDLGWVPLSSLSAQGQSVVASMNTDRVSPPFVDGNDVVLLALRGVRGGDGSAATRYRLAQIVVGVSPGASTQMANAAYARALAAKARLTDCASAERIKREFLPISGNLGEVTAAQLPGPVRAAVATLPVGGISDPLRSNDGFHVVVLCDRIEAASAVPDNLEERAREALVARKLARYARGLLKDLKREAVIERR